MRNYTPFDPEKTAEVAAASARNQLSRKLQKADEAPIPGTYNPSIPRPGEGIHSWAGNPEFIDSRRSSDNLEFAIGYSATTGAEATPTPEV